MILCTSVTRQRYYLAWKLGKLSKITVYYLHVMHHANKHAFLAKKKRNVIVSKQTINELNEVYV